MKGLPVLAILTLVLAPVRARGWSAGASEAAELDLPASALAAVAGPAASVLGRDASVVVDNPALLGRSAAAGVSASHAIRPLGFSDSQGSAFTSVAGVGAAGFQLRVVRGDLTAVTEDGSGAYGGPAGPVGYQAVVATLGAAPSLEALTEGWPVRLRTGAAVTFVRRELADSIAGGVGGSAGAVVEWPFGVSAWATARNLGLTNRTGWPAAFSFGAAWERNGLLLEDDRFSAALGGVLGREPGVGGVLAVEYGLDAGPLGVAARAGWSPATTTSASSWPAAGLVVRASSLALEAGLAPMGDLGWVQVVSLSFQERPPGR